MFLGVTGLLLMLQPVAPPAAITQAVTAAGLPALDGSAFRFADLPAGGGTATVFDARRTSAGTQRTIVSLSATPTGWSVVSRETKRLAGETFDYMSARIDTAIAKGSTVQTACPDGSDYLSERAEAGIVRTLHGCGPDHPNIALARLFGVSDKP